MSTNRKNCAVNGKAVNGKAVNGSAVRSLSSKRTLGLVLVSALAFGACTASTETDLADDVPTIGSAPVGEAIEESGEAVTEPGEEGIGSEVTDPGSSIDETEPDLAMVSDGEISESPAEEPTVEIDPEIDEEGTVEVPQADLGAGESVLCASVQMGLDAVRDNVGEMIEEQKSRLIGGLDSVADGQLASLLSAIEDSSMDEVSLVGALERCEDLGYVS